MLYNYYKNTNFGECEIVPSEDSEVSDASSSFLLVLPLAYAPCHLFFMALLYIHHHSLFHLWFLLFRLYKNRIMQIMNVLSADF